MKPEPLFKSETEMCAAFIEWLKKYPEWTPYNETVDWDILLVHGDGTQIGIQAKLKFNLAVIYQSLEPHYGWSDTGPDYRAVLVPVDTGITSICDVLGLTLIRPRRHWNGSFEFEPGFDARSYAYWHYCNPQKRCKLPSYVPDVPAGVPSPSTLSTWKIGALEICAILELQGAVCREHFRRARIDHRRWTQEWLEAIPDRPGFWRWKPGKEQAFASNHPVVYPQILTKVRGRLVP